MTNGPPRAGEAKRVMEDETEYKEFYESLGSSYPETEVVHAERGVGSRYWTVLQELAPFASQGKSMVDVGCNDGVYTIPYCLMGGSAVGIDISESLVSKARESAARLSLPCRFIQGDIDSSVFPSELEGAFDVALFSEVLEHVRHPSTAMTKIRSFLKDGGYLLLTTPTPLFNNLRSKWRYPASLLAGQKLLEPNTVDTREVPDLVRFGVGSSQYRHDGYLPLALRRYARRFGFEPVKCYTMEFPKRLRRALFVTGANGATGEMVIRRMPIFNLFGVTNVCLMRAVPATNRP